MSLFQQTKQLCQDYNIKPVRSRGQNFLIEEGIYEKVIEAADLKKDDVVLEVGPGLGFLTIKLAKKVKKVIAVEIDKKLAEILQTKLQEEGIGNVEVINADALELRIKNQELGRGYKIVANLPYNISSRFIRKFLAEVANKPKLMILMLQAEVVERLVAKPSDMSLLAVSAQMYADIKKIAKVRADCFWPKPKVESSIVNLTRLRHPLLAKERAGGEVEEKFFKLVKAGFKAKRKQLQGNLKKELKVDKEVIKEILIKNNLPEKVRAQELSLDDWHNIYLALDKRNVL